MQALSLALPAAPSLGLVPLQVLPAAPSLGPVPLQVLPAARWLARRTKNKTDDKVAEKVAKFLEANPWVIDEVAKRLK